jgi:hypothetical protein
MSSSSAILQLTNEIDSLREADTRTPLEVLQRAALDEVTQVLDERVGVEAALDEEPDGELE